jgi:hypothetical protein
LDLLLVLDKYLMICFSTISMAILPSRELHSTLPALRNSPSPTPIPNQELKKTDQQLEYKR